MRIEANGRLRHCFFGNYSAVIGLAFGTADDAALALPLLGEGWTVGERSRHALIWQGGSESLKLLESTFKRNHGLTIDRCTWKECKGDKCHKQGIASIAHSIDYGPSFKVSFLVSDPNQINLF